jgi:hypothetical protein
MMPLSPQRENERMEEMERLDREEFDSAISEEKDAERPAGYQGLPTVSNPGARGGGVNYGGGSQEAKEAREKAASRRGESSSG